MESTRVVDVTSGEDLHHTTTTASLIIIIIGSSIASRYLNQHCAGPILLY